MAKIKKKKLYQIYGVHRTNGNCHILLIYNNTTTLEHSLEFLFKAEILNFSIILWTKIFFVYRASLCIIMLSSSLMDLYLPLVVITKMLPDIAKCHQILSKSTTVENHCFKVKHIYSAIPLPVFTQQT